MSEVEVLGECKVELSPGCSVVGEVTKLSNPRSTQVREVKRFLGVPYGESPVGDLMFKDPVPIKPWQGEKQAKQFGPACHQDLALLAMIPIKFDPPSHMSEDCLHLNVWTPSTSPDSKHPVLVWFYGGGFMSGFTDFYKADALVNFEDVVVVTVSYRVGVWGFLCTGDGAATGNYGLLDQVESLRWVQKNINKFGGDPNNVTIFGESAGGVSTAYHMYCPLSQGLFKNSISQSGTMRSMGVTKTPQEALVSLKLYLKHLGVELSTGQEIVTYLRSQPAEKLILTIDLIQSIFFVPVVDGRVIPAINEQLLHTGTKSKANHMIGVNSHEGAFAVLAICQLMGRDPKSFTLETAPDLIKACLIQSFPGKDTGLLVNDVMKEYFSDVTGPDDVIKRMIDVVTDVTFAASAIETAEAQAGSSKVFVYSFQKRPGFNKYPDYVKADHGFEVPSVFGLPYVRDDLNFSDKDYELSRKIMTYWKNFAKTGNPNGSGLEHWPEYTCTEKKYIVLDDPIKQSADLMGQRVKFWKEIQAKCFST